VWRNVALTLGEGVVHPTFRAGVAGREEPVADAGALLALALERLEKVRAAGGDDVSG